MLENICSTTKPNLNKKEIINNKKIYDISS